jgi:hypothetical protein
MTVNLGVKIRVSGCRLGLSFALSRFHAAIRVAFPASKPVEHRENSVDAATEITMLFDSSQSGSIEPDFCDSRGDSRRLRTASGFNALATERRSPNSLRAALHVDIGKTGTTGWRCGLPILSERRSTLTSRLCLIVARTVRKRSAGSNSVRSTSSTSSMIFPFIDKGAAALAWKTASAPADPIAIMISRPTVRANSWRDSGLANFFNRDQIRSRARRCAPTITQPLRSGLRLCVRVSTCPSSAAA